MADFGVLSLLLHMWFYTFAQAQHNLRVLSLTKGGRAFKIYRKIRRDGVILDILVHIGILVVWY